MLFKIGPVECDARFNADAASGETRQDYAEKPVLGRRPPLDHVGQGAETLSISGRLIVRRLGGLSGLDLLRRAQAQGSPQFVMRGDGVPLGFFVLESVADDHSYLGPDGVGQIVDFSVSMRRADAPTPADAFGAIMALFG